MYNRYVPQPDGSYRRSRMPDNIGQRNQPQPLPVREQRPREEERDRPPEKPVIPEPPACKPEPRPQEPPRRNMAHRPPCRNQARPPQPCIQEKKQESKEASVGAFLRQLLPKDFDTADLLIVLLLLLMSGDCANDQNSAILTLVLYLFM